MKYKILKALKDAVPGYISGGELGKRLAVSRTAVWKYVEELREEGYGIEACSRKGYRLLDSNEKYNAYEIAADLNTAVVGREIIYLDSLDSTNIYARNIAEEGCSEGTVVVAGKQTAGRGRLGRKWESSSDKGIYMSVVLKPLMAPVETPILTLAAAVAVAEAIREATGIVAGIKWPNDLVINGRKVCGILTEMNSESDRVNYIIIGIGLNYGQQKQDFSSELQDRAISLKAACERENEKETVCFSRLSVIRSILQRLDSVLECVQRGDPDTVLKLWRAYSVTLGRRVGFTLKDRDYEGTAVDITEDGRLIVDCDDGVRRELFSGEVSVRGIYGYAG